jgi:5S rRNA maturation endonuclease (ribonuclease M5)
MYSSFDVERIANALGKARKNKDGYQCCCPCHDDQKASLGVKLSPDNEVIFNCLAGCEWKAIKEECTRRGLLEEFKPSRPLQAVPQLPRKDKYAGAIFYVYYDSVGNPVARKVRFEPKDFTTERYEGGRFVPSLNGVTVPLYNLRAVAAAETVYLCEGEKDAETLIEAGLVATTNHAGATSWAPHLTEQLKNKTVIIIPDNDEAGFKRVDILNKALHGVAKKILHFVPDGVKKKGDITNWVKDLGNDPSTILERAVTWEVRPEPAPAPKLVAKPSAYAELLASMPECPVKDLAYAIDATLETNQPGIALAAALAFFATVRSRVTYLNSPQLWPKHVYSNEWFCLLARSGCGKSTAMEVVEDLLAEVGLGCFRMHQPASSVALREQLAGTERLFCWDEFGEAFAHAIAGKTSPGADIIRESKIFWARNKNILGKGYAKGADRAPIDIPEAYFSWFTATTANRIKEALSGKFVLDGFVPRFIFVEGEEQLSFKKQRPFECPQSVKDIISELYPPIKSSGDIGSTITTRNPYADPIEVVFEPEALEESLKYKSAWQKYREVFKDDVDDALFNKRLGHYLKLCLIVAPCSIVYKETSRWVHKFVTLTMDRQLEICESEIGRGDISDLKERLLQLVPENDWIKRSDLFDKAAHHVEGKVRIGALKDLEEEDKVYCLKIIGKPGQPPVEVTRSKFLFEARFEEQREKMGTKEN